MLKRIDNSLKLCFPSSTITVPTFKKARTEYCGDRAIDRDKTDHLIVHCEHFQMEINQRQDIQASF